MNNNNIGTIAVKLPRTIGGEITITDAANLTAVSGYVDIGFMCFDDDGTMGMCVNFTRDDQDKPIYVFRTCSLNTEIDVQHILGQSY